ncbi:glycosyltransferase involved in cell wall biosynthesis [Algoriphagus sp. 4150]|uniref:glycosyltransferase n=1 Tax=Algoriphagus sp. 4150 TaxID=2817756 RepID=UPI00285EE359|nr:glycosyltransferase [Algoriphagus sp. 4150]MDR7129517.1 glycosyltransferase involved in cell wall biosynthesis [Algoriphagus sp. 4150]
MNSTDRVTVVCIAFNHEKWIEKALVSVLLQDYQHKELIIVDNGSEDQTPDLIKEWMRDNSEKLSVKAIYKSKSEPYCRLFNEILNQVDSRFVVDLSGDDFLYAHHLSFSIDRLHQNPDAAFVFSDAVILDELGNERPYYTREDYGNLQEKILAGDLYETLIRRSYISAPSVVFNTGILKQVGGYDASLHYEDFDIQLRLARNYPLAFSEHIGVLKRKHANSLSASQYRRYHSEMLSSTLRICEKIRRMNKNPKENAALSERVLHELKHALWSANFQIAKDFVKLGNDLNMNGLEFGLYKVWLFFRLDFSWLYANVT